MSRYCVWVVVVVLVLAGCGGGHRGSAARAGGPMLTGALARTLDAQFRREVTEAGIPGASAAIVFPDGREWNLAVGAAELKPRVAMTTRTSFHFSGVTRMATAALALRLAEQGRLGLDDPIIRWYPAWRGDRSATVRDLLGHTAGAKDPTDAALAGLLRGGPFTVRAYIRVAPRPGPRTTQAEDSNVGFVIAGIVLARAAREPLAQAMRRRVLSVPGGAGLALQPGERPHPPLVHNYYYPRSLSDPVDLSDGSGLIPNRGVALFAGAGGLAGDVPSLARWGHALLGGGLLSPSSLRAMTRFHDISPVQADALYLPARQSYGLGLFRDSLDGHLMWGHPGGGDGNYSELWHLPHDRITIAVSWNDDAIDRASSPLLDSLLQTTLASH